MEILPTIFISISSPQSFHLQKNKKKLETCLFCFFGFTLRISSSSSQSRLLSIFFIKSHQKTQSQPVSYIGGRIQPDSRRTGRRAARLAPVSARWLIHWNDGDLDTGRVTRGILSARLLKRAGILSMVRGVKGKGSIFEYGGREGIRYIMQLVKGSEREGIRYIMQLVKFSYLVEDK